MKTYTARFKKKNGDMRSMYFSKLKDLPETFIDKLTSGEGSAKNYPKGMELVFDLEAKNFRVFNWKTKEGPVYQEDIDESFLQE